MAVSTTRPLVYPEIPPVLNSSYAGLAGLGANWNPGGEGVTPWIDYIRFTIYRPTYDGKAVLESVRKEAIDVKKSGLQLGPSIYLYMPANIAVSYGANYTNKAFGVTGIMAAQMLGGNGAGEEIAKTLQNAAAGATPEAGFNAVAEAATKLGQFMGVGGDVNGSDLAAVSQGRIFNPYEEQIFNGVSFRSHNFQFKLVARSKEEAQVIDGILKTFKSCMLPTYNPGDAMGAAKKAASTAATGAKSSTSKDGSGSVADSLTPPFSNVANRYLSVPSRTRVEFIRVQNVRGNFGNYDVAPNIVGLFKLKDCVIDGLQANYTPDGAYVNTNDGYVPAIDLSISLKEISLVTSEDIAQGF